MSSPIHPVAAEPMLDYGEAPLLKRKDIQFTLTGGAEKVRTIVAWDRERVGHICIIIINVTILSPQIKAKGNVFLTTHRVIFMGNKRGELCEMNLIDISNEKFNQPLFGANSISGTIPPAKKWKMTFNMFLRLTSEIKRKNLKEM